MFISFIVILLSNYISVKAERDRNKLSPFECGFKHHSNSRPVFSRHFFLVSLIFLIFDVELILLYPVLFKQVSLVVGPFSLYLLILVILTVGTLYEWAQKSLD